METIQTRHTLFVFRSGTDVDSDGHERAAESPAPPGACGWSTKDAPPVHRSARRGCQRLAHYHQPWSRRPQKRDGNDVSHIATIKKKTPLCAKHRGALMADGPA